MINYETLPEQSVLFKNGIIC